MKTKKQKDTANHEQKKKNHAGPGFAPFQKQFELMYRTCDKLPSSEQYQSVFFVKHKKITGFDATNESKKKEKSKNSSGKKKKREEKQSQVEPLGFALAKRDVFSATKSTIPTFTEGTYKKTAVPVELASKIDFAKTSIKKLNNNFSNSNSSRYLASKNLIRETKSPASNNKKNVPKSPSKRLVSPVRHQETSKNSQLRPKNSQKLKNIKSRREIKETVKQQDENTPNCEYVFLNGEYIQVQNQLAQLIAERVKQNNIQKQSPSCNEFIDDFQGYKSTLNHNQSQQQTSRIDEESQKYILQCITRIQRWWRNCLRKQSLQKCNMIPHHNSNVASETTIQIQRTIEQAYQLQPHTQEKESGLSFLEVREKLIVQEMESKKQILEKMLQMNKIDSLTYAQILMKTEEKFYRDMQEIVNLREKIHYEAEKTEALQHKINQSGSILSSLDQMPANAILEQFFPKSSEDLVNPIEEQPQQSRVKSTGCHYSSLNQSQSAEVSAPVTYKKKGKESEQKLQITSPLAVKPQTFEADQDDEEEEDQNPNEPEEQEVQMGSHIIEEVEMLSEKQRAQIEIQRRQAMQLGMGQYTFQNKNKQISTSVVGIHNFLSNFLKFYEYFYKEEFLKMINVPYGYNQLTRLKQLQGYTSGNWISGDEDEETFFGVDSIITQEILEDFQEHSYQLPEEMDDSLRAMISFDKIHQRAVIDCFNQALNCFRAYYFINGAPYSWIYSEKALTYYYIAEENIKQVFDKTQFKVLKSASALCGTIVEDLQTKSQMSSQMSLQEQLAAYQQCVHPVLAQNREDKLTKVQKQEVQEKNYQWQFFEEQRTAIMLQLSNSIFEALVMQVIGFAPSSASQTSQQKQNNQATASSEHKPQNNSEESYYDDQQVHFQAKSQHKIGVICYDQEEDEGIEAGNAGEGGLEYEEEHQAERDDQEYLS